jgi:hypothetical protein
MFQAAGDQVMVAVAGGARGFVAVGFTKSEGDVDAAVWTSPDGAVWKPVTHAPALGGPGDQRMLGIVYTRAGFVATGQDRSFGAIWTSSDGRHWQLASPLQSPRDVVLRTPVVEGYRVYVLGDTYAGRRDSILRTGVIRAA